MVTFLTTDVELSKTCHCLTVGYSIFGAESSVASDSVADPVIKLADFLGVDVTGPWLCPPSPVPVGS